MSESVMTRRQPVPLNGVDTPNLFATINAVKGAPELAKFQFRAVEPLDDGHPQPEPHRVVHAAPAASTRTRARSSTTPTIRRCSSAATRARRRSSSCSTRSPPA